MTPDLFSRAMNYANMAHYAKVDKGGHPYILHPLRVMMRLRTDDLHEMALAIMHDTIEDSQTTFRTLLLDGFSQDFVTDLRLLTRQAGQTYDEYIEAMRGNIRVLRVKYQDLRDNSDITRLKGIREKDVERMVKYQKAFVRVTEMIREIEVVGEIGVRP